MFYAGYADGDASAVRTLHAVGTTKRRCESIRRAVVLNDTHRLSRTLLRQTTGCDDACVLSALSSSCRLCRHGHCTDGSGHYRGTGSDVDHLLALSAMWRTLAPESRAKSYEQWCPFPFRPATCVVVQPFCNTMRRLRHDIRHQGQDSKIRF